MNVPPRVAGPVPPPPPGPVDLDPEFGDLIAELRPTVLTWLLVLACLAVAAAGVMFPTAWFRLWLFPWTISTAAPPPRGAPAPPDPYFWTLAALGGLVCAAFLGLSWFLALSALTKHRCHVLGVRTFRLGRLRRSLAYADCTEILYRRVQQSYHGISETKMTLTLRAATGPRLRWVGIYPANPQSFLADRGPLGGVRAVEAVLFTVSEAIADAWVDRLTEGRTLRWTRKLEMSADGLRTVSGWRRGRVLPFERFGRIEYDGARARLFEAGSTRPWITLDVHAPNYWPGAATLGRMLRALQPANEPEDDED